MAGEFTLFGKIHFQKASSWINASNVCEQDGYLYHKTKDGITVSHCNDDGDNCTTSYRPLVQPVNSTRQRCSKFEDDNCVAYVTVPYVQGTVTNMVYSSQNAWQDGEAAKASYKYTVDSCN